MFRRTRTPKPSPTLPDPASLARALRVLADDAAAGFEPAIAFFEDGPSHDGILAYPTSHWRALNLAYLGKPRPGLAPDDYQLPAGYRIPAQYLAPGQPTA
ncbi:hypothetical protein ACIPXV_09515 [Streptomyces libani]|uniref:hypothetical protein n=1 Tax=Streptomyces nigrescens TaxID=1920 RepID=UPI00380E378E